MRFKSLKLFFLSFGALHSSLAAISVALPPSPGTNIVTTDSGNAVYILTESAIDSTINTDYNSEYHLRDSTFRIIDLTDANTVEQITLRLTGFDSTKPYIHLFWENPGDADSLIKAPFLSVTDTVANDATNGTFQVSNPAYVDVAFNLSGQCVLSATLSASESCETETGGLNKVPSYQGLRLRIVESASSSTPSATSAEYTSGVKFRIYPQKSFPKFEADDECPVNQTLNDKVFYPGDGAVVIQLNNFVPVAATTSPGSAVFNQFLVRAWQDTADHVPSDAATISAMLEAGSDGRITNFKNSTTDEVIHYQLAVGVKDSAGAITYCHTSTGTGTGSTVLYQDVFASQILGFLKEGNCFIATATYENSWHPNVLLFRQFRDQFLGKFALGRFFIQNYYHYSPRAAEWLIQHPHLRPIFKAVFQPIGTWVWFVLHPILFIGSLLAVGILFFRRRWSLAKNFNSKNPHVLPLLLAAFILLSSSSAFALGYSSGGTEESDELSLDAPPDVEVPASAPAPAPASGTVKVPAPPVAEVPVVEKPVTEEAVKEESVTDAVPLEVPSDSLAEETSPEPSLPAAESAPPVPPSPQPYIDSLMSGLSAEEGSQSTTDSSGKTYTEKLRDALPAKDENSYTETLKGRIGAGSDADKNYSNKLQTELGKKPGGSSAIADLQSNRELKADKGDRYTRTAFNLKVATTLNRTYSAPGVSSDQYENVYGEGWQPDLLFTYEWRPLWKTTFLDGLGLLAGTGFTTVAGKGKFTYVAGFGEDSSTRVRLITVPLYVGPIFRINLGKIFAPFVAAGIGVLGFYERRADQGKDIRGRSFMTTFSFGANIGLSWISSKSSWDAYQNSFIKHTYLTVDYTRQQTLSGGVADATISGVSGGVLFEF
jgi:hypothetical protein